MDFCNCFLQLHCMRVTCYKVMPRFSTDMLCHWLLISRAVTYRLKDYADSNNGVMPVYIWVLILWGIMDGVSSQSSGAYVNISDNIFNVDTYCDYLGIIYDKRMVSESWKCVTVCFILHQFIHSYMELFCTCADRFPCILNMDV